MLSAWHRMFATAVVIGLMGVLAYRATHWTQVLAAALVVVPFLGRDAFLPFLGRAAYPCDSLAPTVPPGADTQLVVRATPGARVAYWAADGPSGDNYRVAYGDLSNAGIAVADREGLATLTFRAPRGYSVRWKKLAPHVHYRVCAGHGMFGRVQTAFARRG
jgi:hypothetical protein